MLNILIIFTSEDIMSRHI